MLRPVLATALLCFSSWGLAAHAETVQQDRRIEEEKREHLQPTVPSPSLSTELSAQQLQGPPVPQPLKELYVMTLLQKRIAFNYDAAKAIIILMGVDEEYLDLNAQAAYLKDAGFLPNRLRDSFDPMQPLRRGLAAYMFQHALKIRGGIAWHLFGPTQRYALKELVHRGIMADGHAQDLISGEELVQIMSQVAQRKAKPPSAITP